MKKRVSVCLITGLFMFSTIGMAEATIIDLSLGGYTSPYWSGTGIYPEYTVGTFNFDLLGETVISASINGSWTGGAHTMLHTAHNFLELDGIEVADTHDYPDPTFFGGDWSYTISDFSIFSDGSAVFDVTQTSPNYVRLDDTYLTIETSASVPEPATMLLLATGLAGLAGTRLKRKKKVYAN